VEIAEQTVDTPYDSPFGYDASWRNELAKLCVEDERTRPPIIGDVYLAQQLKYLREVTSEKFSGYYGVMPLRKRKRIDKYAVHQANRIYMTRDEMCLKDKLDALLLCPELPMQKIAKDIGIRVEVVKAYERIFFNVRDEDGIMNLSQWLKEYFTHSGDIEFLDPGDKPLYWRTLATTTGWKMLYYQWGWQLPGNEIPEAEAVMDNYRLMMGDLHKRVLYNKIDSKALVDMMRGMHEKIDDMRGQGLIAGGGDTESEVSMIFKLLYATRPSPTPPTVEQLEEKEADVQLKIAQIRDKFSKGAKEEGKPSTEDYIATQMAGTTL